LLPPLMNLRFQGSWLRHHALLAWAAQI